MLAPWADVLYAADSRWWDSYKKDVADFAGMKVGPDLPALAAYKILRVKLHDEESPAAIAISLEPGVIARGGNSGFQALNLAIQFGTKRILLFGFDLTGEHWHGKHPEPLKNPRPQTLDKWCARLDAQAPRLAAIGVEVINVSNISKLTAYPKMNVDAAFSRWR